MQIIKKIGDIGKSHPEKWQEPSHVDAAQKW